MTLRVGIAVFERVEELDAVGPYQVFGTTASLRGDMEVFTVSVSGRLAIRCVNGLQITADWLAGEEPPMDLLIIPGGVGTRVVAQDENAVSWTRAVAARVQMLGSVCSGARVTLAAGLAAGKRITTHHSVIEELRSDGRAAEVLEGVRFVRDGTIVHSAGISAGIDMSLWFVGNFIGDAALEEKVRAQMEYYPGEAMRAVA